MCLKRGRMAPALVMNRFTKVKVCRRSLQVGRALKGEDKSDKAASDSFANGSNATYIDRLYRKWVKDPNSVDEVKLFFTSFFFVQSSELVPHTT